MSVEVEILLLRKLLDSSHNRNQQQQLHHDSNVEKITAVLKGIKNSLLGYQLETQKASQSDLTEILKTLIVSDQTPGPILVECIVLFEVVLNGRHDIEDLVVSVVPSLLKVLDLYHQPYQQKGNQVNNDRLLLVTLQTLCTACEYEGVRDLVFAPRPLLVLTKILNSRFLYPDSWNAGVIRIQIYAARLAANYRPPQKPGSQPAHQQPPPQLLEQQQHCSSSKSSESFFAAAGVEDDDKIQPNADILSHILEGLLDLLSKVAPLLLAPRKNYNYDPHHKNALITLIYYILTALAYFCSEGSTVALLSQQNCTYVASFSGGSPTLHSLFPESKWPIVSLLFNLVMHSSSLLKLGSITLLSKLWRSGVLGKQCSKQLSNTVLPVLVNLLGIEGPVEERAPFVLAFLLTDNEEMQKAASNANAVQKLSSILQQIKLNCSPENKNQVKILQGVLESTAAITLFKDEYRKQVIDHGIVPYIVSAMSHPCTRVRVAACLCARSLSRSVSILRTSLMDADISSPLFKLLTDPEMDVKVSACAALCNLVLEFSPLRKPIIDSGVIDIVCEHSQSSNHALRLNAVWAFKHLMYAAEPDLRVSALAKLGTENLIKLCNDPVPGVQEQALDVIRNICSRSEGLQPLIESIGAKELMNIVRDKLSSPYAEIVGPAVYTCVHIAAGENEHRALLMQEEDILMTIKRHMSHSKVEIRIACVWMVINLTWVEEDANQKGKSTNIVLLSYHKI